MSLNLTTTLPRLAFISDVPVEATCHGSALVFRLLQEYPSEQLRIVETNILSSTPEKRLPNVAYSTQHLGSKRLLSTRFYLWYSTYLFLKSPHFRHSLHAKLSRFAPQAILTVAHGYLWIAAARYAQERKIPLHLIIHDDWIRTFSLPYPFTGMLDKVFGQVYRSATTRLCVSPYMVTEYEHRYSVSGNVLYPSRSREQTVFGGPPSRITKGNGARVFAFAGSINTAGYARLIRDFANRLASSGGRLLIFGPLTPTVARQVGLDLPNVELAGMVPQGEIISRLRSEADVLFVPMSFAESDRPNMEVSFPSKLTDYTAVGLPLLICGPEYCSAVRWAQDNPGVAEVSTDEQLSDLDPAIIRLMSSAEHCQNLAMTALEVGQRYFSYSTARQLIQDAISTNRSSSSN